ncbi:MAG TPA: DedA family protein [Deltaproteobacteria bacterium]|jgi:membrane-associated protein|nr:DedA family protein [Deltaproteobacteria bacterium]
MDLLHHALDIFLHLDQHLNDWAGVLGPFLYLLLFAVVFCETGLVLTPFLPGDSLLFAVGALCSIDASPISLPLMGGVLLTAAVLGDACNYAIGHYLGPMVFTSERSRLLSRRHLLRTQEFYARHGGKTIFLARFVPIIRTFAPFVAGIGRMRYRHFALWNVSGAAVWVAGLVLAGYQFGQIPLVKRNFETVILAIVAISLLPIFVEFVRARRAAGVPGTP